MPKDKGVEWNHVTDCGTFTNGNHKVSCKYCGIGFAGGAFRIRHHIISVCQDAPKETRDELMAMDKLKKSINESRQDSRIKCRQQSLTCQTTLKQLNAKTKKDRIDEAVADFFYKEGVPLKKVESEAFKTMATHLAASGTNYKSPNAKNLKSDLLDSSVNRASAILSRLQGEGRHATLCTDGWSSFDEKKLINVMIGNCENAAFYKTIDCSGKAATIDFIFNLVKDCVEELKKEHNITIIGVCTDSAANMKAARERLQTELGLINTPCICHTVDLIVEDIGKLDWGKAKIDRALKVNLFVRSHEKLHHWLKTQSTCKRGLKRKSKTRFLTVNLVLVRLLEQHDNLEALLVSPEAKNFYNRSTRAVKDAYDECKTEVMSPSFWKDVEYIVHVMDLPAEFLRMADGHKNPVIG